MVYRKYGGALMEEKNIYHYLFDKFQPDFGISFYLQWFAVITAAIAFHKLLLHYVKTQTRCKTDDNQRKMMLLWYVAYRLSWNWTGSGL